VLLLLAGQRLVCAGPSLYILTDSPP